MSEAQLTSALQLAQPDAQTNDHIIDAHSPLNLPDSHAAAVYVRMLFPVLVCLTVFAGCQRSTPAQVDVTTSPNVTTATPTDARSKAMAAKDALFSRLSARLTEVMQTNGPAAAIDVCSREAAEIAKSVGQEHGVTIGRTSLKLRNPQNSPPDWVKPLIVEPQDEPLFIELPDGHTGALLPIKLQAKCTLCHGPSDTIADDVKTQLAKLYPDDQATGFKEGDLRGWFWIDVPAGEADNNSASKDASNGADEDSVQNAQRMGQGPGMGHHAGMRHGPGMGPGPGMGRGPGMMGRGSEMREDATTLHAMFDTRDKIKRTVKNLPNGAEAITESDDPDIVALIQEHVPAMQERVHENNPLPPMTFHPIFVELIKHAEDYTLTYEETGKGVKATYYAEDPFVIMLVQEHAKLVSRFIKNGMPEIHKPYTLPKVNTMPSGGTSGLKPLR